MKILTKEFKDVAKKILESVDTKSISTVTDVVELVTANGNLYFNVTNQEYYVSIKFPVGETDSLHATVNANLFLKLIDKTTSEYVELKVVNNTLVVKGNGDYKLPIISDNSTGEMVVLPTIDLDNIVAELEVPAETLNSLITYNSKEINKEAKNPAQSMYYMDDAGAVTFAWGACVNSFELSKPIKVLFKDRMVKLFKLFKSGDVHFEMAEDKISETITQVKVAFTAGNIRLTAITGCNNELLNAFPADKIRARATKEYPNNISLNKSDVATAVDRLLLFISTDAKPYSVMEFNADNVVIYDNNKEQKEIVPYESGTLAVPFEFKLDLSAFKRVVDSCSDSVRISFGEDKAIIVSVKDSIKNVIPRVKN